jgi:NAD(P)-dependent dehydrogenase (short-subunit alcohol dehydrogenase family)
VTRFQPGVDQQPGLVVVTGGSRGIGAATARRLAAEGWNVQLTYRSERAEAEKVVADCRAAGVCAAAMQVDITVEAQVVELFRSLPSDGGPLRGLVNNAGIVAPSAKVAEMGIRRLHDVFAVNVFGAFLCSREAVRIMSDPRAGSGGSIVNISSRAALLGSPNEYVDYAASKAALDALTTGLALEVADQGIRVNSVRPGVIDTDIHARNGEPRRPQRLAPGLPMKRPGTADEVAAAVCWLLSDVASYTTGAFLDVSGGR